MPACVTLSFKKAKSKGHDGFIRAHQTFLSLALVFFMINFFVQIPPKMIFMAAAAQGKNQALT